MNEYNFKIELQNRLIDYLNIITQLDGKGKDKYICPICNSGTKHHKTGALSYFIDKKGIPRVTCFACNQIQNDDIFALVGKIENLQDFPAQRKRICEIFGYKDIKENHKPAPIKEKSLKEPKPNTDYTDFFLKAHSGISKTDYLANRGISLDIINKFKLGYIEGWKLPEKDKMHPINALIIPINKNSYIARDINKKTSDEYRFFKVGNSQIFNLSALFNNQDKPVFVVEGELDALSILTVGAEAIGLGSIANIDKFINTYKEKRFSAPLIVSLDNDEQGKMATERIEKSLKALKIPHLIRNVSGSFKDANEAIIANKIEFTQAIKNAENMLYDKLSNKELVKRAKGINIDKTKVNNKFLDYDTDDLANAERLSFIHGENILYSSEMNKWYIYNGKIWAEDKNGKIFRRAWQIAKIYQNTANQSYLRFKSLNSFKSDREAKENAEFQRIKLHKTWADKSLTLRKIEDMVKVAGTYHYVGQDELDTQNHYITCKNGTLDLNTGQLVQHNPDDLITKFIDLNYNPQARAPIFENFLNKIFNNDKDLIDYIHHAMGYTMTGETREQCFFIAYGTGSNGKSTLFEIVAHILKDYTQSIPTAVLMDNQKRGSEASPELARAKGQRFIIASESQDLAVLNENQIKALTGNDTIAVRPLYAQGFTYKPTYKIWLGTNHKPIIKGTDNGIWRRVKFIPFLVTIPDNEQDKLLLDKLKAESAGVFNWLIQGAIKYYKNGLPKNKTVDEATKEYRAEMDTLQAFIDDCIEEKQGEYIKAGALYEVFKLWAKDNAMYEMTNTQFGRKILEKGINKKRLAGGVGNGYINYQLSEQGKTYYSDFLNVPKEFI